MSKQMIRRLLSGRNSLTRQEKDQIFEGVLRQVAPRSRRLQQHWGKILLATAGAVALVVLIPMALRQGPPSTAEFGTRGQGRAVASLQMACSSAAAGAVCARDSKLLFDLSRTAGYRYFAAFARHEDGTVIWYFPESPTGTGLDLGQRMKDGVVDRGVVLGKQHRPGRYQVFGLFTNQALTRELIRQRFDEKAMTLGPDSAVVVRKMELR